MFRAIILSLVLLSTGCAVFDGNNIPDIALPTSFNSEDVKPSLSVSTVAMGGFSLVKELPEAAQNIIEAEFLSVLEESGYFSRVSKDDQTADINISATLTETGNPAALVPAFITGLSLYTIPSWAKSNFKLDAKVESSSVQEKYYAIEDSATLVQWLPMLFVFPVNNFSVIPEVRKNMYRKMLSDMEQDGLFEIRERQASVLN